MKKPTLILFGILLIMVLFTGCNEQQTSQGIKTYSTCGQLNGIDYSKADILCTLYLNNSTNVISVNSSMLSLCYLESLVGSSVCISYHFSNINGSIDIVDIEKN